MEKEKLFNAIDLFAGCGGLSLGLSDAGFNVLYANEINKTAANTYSFNLIGRKKHNTFMDVRSISDVSTSEIKKIIKNKEIHLVAGGPPCQGFSMAGKRDVNDPRNRLFKEMLRVVNDIHPPLFLLENVKGILSMQSGNVIKVIRESFEELGYNVKIEILKASDFGVPQERERVFIIGTRIGNGVLHPKSNMKKPINLSEAIGDLDFLDSGEMSEEYKSLPISKYQKIMRKGCKKLYNHEAPNHSNQVIKRFSSMKPGQSGKDLPNDLKTKKQVLKKLEANKPAKTVTTLPEDYVHYKMNRILTVREMARIQSFPDDFVFLGPRTTGGERRKYELPQYSQIGNAVPPILAKKVGEHLIKCLNIHSDNLK